MTAVCISKSFGALMLITALGQISIPLLAQQPAIQIRNNRAEAIAEFQRPLKGNERAALVRSGVRVYRPLGGNRYLVRINRDGLTAIQSHPLFVRISEVNSSTKISATIRSGQVPTHARGQGGAINVVVRFYPDVEFGQANSVLRRNGLTVAQGKSSFGFRNALEASGTSAQISALATSNYVASIQEVSPPSELHNAAAATLSNVPQVRTAPYNLTGAGVNVGVWDGGRVRIEHDDLEPRVTVGEAGDDGFASRDHGTHVTGTIAGSGANNANARGMATGATVFTYRFRDGDHLAEQQAAFDNVNQAIRTSNHSWGAILGWDGQTPPSDTGNNNLFGAYEGDAGATDQLARDRTALTIVNSAGNDDGDCGGMPQTCDGFLAPNGQYYDLLGTWKNAKNVITVAALNADGTTKASFSSTGPSDDGRIKPDISASGASLTSTCSSSDTDYCAKGGTSMSTPVVTGVVALMIQHYRQRYGTTATPSSDIMKALLTNTAADIGRPGPDYQFGFGRLDALAAAQTVDAGPVRILTGSVDQGDVDEFLLPVPGGLPNLRVTLNWIDPPGGESTSDDDNALARIFHEPSVQRPPFLA
jgi:subtilisin family serine protease